MRQIVTGSGVTDLDTFSFVDSPRRRERRIYKKKRKRNVERIGKKKQEGNTIQRGQVSKELDRINEESFALTR